MSKPQWNGNGSPEYGEELLDDAYKSYCNAHPNLEKTFEYEGSKIEVRKMTKEEFINQIKTDNEFANMWM
jgi:hypothetical protein